MLAQNFKTPADLKITDAEFGALAKVLGMLERGELVRPEVDGLWPTGNIPNGFHMGSVAASPKCGTVACILGWALIVGNDAKLFAKYEFNDVCRADRPELGGLFMYGDCRRFDVTPDEAAIALRNYLTHGEPRWAEALAD